MEPIWNSLPPKRLECSVSGYTLRTLHVLRVVNYLHSCRHDRMRPRRHNFVVFELPRRGHHVSDRAGTRPPENGRDTRSREIAPSAILHEKSPPWLSP